MSLFGFGKKKKEAELAAQQAAEAEAAAAAAKQLEDQRAAHEGIEWPKVQPLNLFRITGSEQSPILEDQVSPERKEELGNLIYEEKLPLKLVSGLSMQELLFLMTAQELFHSRAPLRNFESNHRILYNEMLGRIRDAEKIYLLNDTNTNYPFLDHGYACIYLDRELAEKAAEAYKSQNRKLTVRECLQAGAGEAAGNLGIFDYLYYLGMEHIIIDNGLYRAHFRRSEIVAAPNWSEDTKVPPCNPELVYALLDFLGEIRWPVQYEKREQIAKAKEMRMLQAIREAEFIVPVQLQNDKPTEQGSPIDPGAVMVPSLRDPNGKEYLPIFTDGVEMAKQFSGQAVQAGRFKYPVILKMLENKDGFVINPFGQNVIMPKERMLSYEMAARASAAVKKAQQQAQQQAQQTQREEGEKQDV